MRHCLMETSVLKPRTVIHEMGEKMDALEMAWLKNVKPVLFPMRSLLYASNVMFLNKYETFLKTFFYFLATRELTILRFSITK